MTRIASIWWIILIWWPAQCVCCDVQENQRGFPAEPRPQRARGLPQRVHREARAQRLHARGGRELESRAEELDVEAKRERGQCSHQHRAVLLPQPRGARVALLPKSGVSGVSAGARGAQATLHQERQRPEARRTAGANVDQEKGCTPTSTGEKIHQPAQWSAVKSLIKVDISFYSIGHFRWMGLIQTSLCQTSMTIKIMTLWPNAWVETTFFVCLW